MQQHKTQLTDATLFFKPPGAQHFVALGEVRSIEITFAAEEQDDAVKEQGGAA